MTRSTLVRALLAASLSTASTGASAQRPLRVHVPVSDSLGVHEAHAYTLRLAKGDVAVGDADGPDVDMVVRVERPDGTVLESFDTGGRGPEPFSFEADAAGVFTVVATPFREETGRYTLTLYRAAPPATDTLGRVAEALSVFGGAGRPGAVLVIVRNGEIAETIAQGLGADGEPAGFDTRYDAGSIGESMTAAAARTLARAGRLDFDAPVQRYLPDLPAPTGPVTVYDLMEHQTGFLDLTVLTWFRGWPPRDPIWQSAAAEALRYQSTLAGAAEAPRTSGGQTDHMLLALVIEATTGEPFGAWMQTHLFAPLGMTRTVVKTAPGQTVAGVPAGYGASGVIRPASGNADGTYGWGNVYTTPADLVRWMTAVTGGRPDVVAPWELPPATSEWNEVLTGGLIGIRQRGVFRAQSRGIVDGFDVSFEIDPTTGSGYALLTNTSRQDDIVTPELLAYVFPGWSAPEPTTWPPEAEPPPPVPTPEETRARLEARSGRYANAYLGTTYTVSIDEMWPQPRLFLTDAAGTTTELYDGYYGSGRDDWLYSPDVLGLITFEPAAPARPEAFVLHGAGREGIRFDRLPD